MVVLMNVCVSMYVYMYVCTCMYMYVCMYVSSNICICVFVCVACFLNWCMYQNTIQGVCQAVGLCSNLRLVRIQAFCMFPIGDIHRDKLKLGNEACIICPLGCVS